MLIYFTIRPLNENNLDFYNCSYPPNNFPLSCPTLIFIVDLSFIKIYIFPYFIILFRFMDHKPRSSSTSSPH